jgi:hypothetical protein
MVDESLLPTRAMSRRPPSLDSAGRTDVVEKPNQPESRGIAGEWRSRCPPEPVSARAALWWTSPLRARPRPWTLHAAPFAGREVRKSGQGERPLARRRRPDATPDRFLRRPVA